MRENNRAGCIPVRAILFAESKWCDHSVSLYGTDQIRSTYTAKLCPTRVQHPQPRLWVLTGL